MKKEQDIKHNRVSCDPKTEHQNNAVETPGPDSGSESSNDNTKVSREDIELVQNLIERCLQLYMNRDEVVKTLTGRAMIDPGFTTLVWRKLEEENAEFFRAYYIRLKLKKQIILFNHMLQHQYHLMNYQAPQRVPLAPMENGIHPMHVNNLPMGYPVMQPHLVPATGQSHIDHMGYHASNCLVVNGVPAPVNIHPMSIHSGNDMVIDNTIAEISPIMVPNNATSDMPVSPASVASSSHFLFSSSDIPGMGVDTSVLDTTYTSDMASSVGLHIPWDFSLSDLTADLSDMGDLGDLGNYTGSAFLHPDSDILLDSPEPDDTVEEFFVDNDSVPEQCPPLEEKSQ